MDLFKWFRRRPADHQSGHGVVAAPVERPVRTVREELVRQIEHSYIHESYSAPFHSLTPWEISKMKQGICPDCGSTGGFCEGPSGGMATNWACPKCRHVFNIVEGMPQMSERITARDSSS